MLGEKAFISIIKEYLYFIDRNSKFGKDLEKVFGSKYEPTDCWSTEDNSIWLNWAIVGVGKIVKEIILDFGETDDGADYWLYEGIDMITKGGTTVVDNNIEYNITNFNELYNFLITLKNEKK